MFLHSTVLRPVLAALVVAVALLGHEAAVAETTTVNLYLVDPFLLGTLDKGADLGNLDLGTLYLRRNWTTVKAAGLVADSTSAAIAVVETSSGTGSVTLTATGGAVLLPYNAKFLAQAPGVGTITLTIPAADLVKVGSVYFAAALVQAPPAGAARSFSTPVSVTATRNSVEKQATLALSPPPVVLVHGLWGDASSLEDLDRYLLATAPWKQSGLVEPICYSPYLAFDAATDPLPRDSDSCEVTSKTALDNEIGHLMAVLDSRHIVGGRIDMVAHSMGGLVARHYSALPEYSGARNRGQGAFHELVTLDAPEQGSALATYLYNHAGGHLEAPIFSGPWNLWEAECDSGNSVRACFNRIGLPLAAGSLTLNTGAVYSLIPGGKSLTAAPDPRIPGTIWRAVTATWSQNDRPSSLLRSVLNTLIRAIYKSGQTPADTVGILGTELNDVIVTTKSQLGDAQQSFNFHDLAHTKTPDPSILGIFFDGVNQNIEESASVDRLAGCWLANLGAASCTQGIVQPAEVVAKVAAAPKPEKFLAADRLTLGAVSAAPRFGVPFELPLRFGSEVPDSIVVSQSDSHGEIASGSGAAAIVRQAGGVSFIRITPRRFGPMKFTVAASFADGGVALRSFTADVGLPATSPTAFSAGRSPMVIVLKADEPVAPLQPEATYPNIGTVRLAPRQVTATVEQSAGAPVISLQGGVIRALRPGTATIEARFGGAVDRVKVIVKPSWE